MNHTLEVVNECKCHAQLSIVARTDGGLAIRCAWSPQMASPAWVRKCKDKGRLDLMLSLEARARIECVARHPFLHFCRTVPFSCPLVMRAMVSDVDRPGYCLRHVVSKKSADISRSRVADETAGMTRCNLSVDQRECVKHERNCDWILNANDQTLFKCRLPSQGLRVTSAQCSQCKQSTDA
jgi:hypothetical protein